MRYEIDENFYKFITKLLKGSAGLPVSYLEVEKMLASIKEIPEEKEESKESK